MPDQSLSAIEVGGPAEISVTSGTGDYTLKGAIPGCVRFADRVASGLLVTYTVTDGVQSETSKGVFTAPSGLSRDEVLTSTNSGSPIDWPSSGQRIVRLAVTVTGAPPTFQSQHLLHQAVPVGATKYFPLFTPANAGTSDITIVSLEITQETISNGTYDFTIQAGSTVVGPDYPQVDAWDLYNDGGNLFTSDYHYRLPERIFIPYTLNTFHNTNQIYIRVQNEGGLPLVLSFQVVGMVAATSGIVLPLYVAPPQYNGPLMHDVYVGPDLIHYPDAGWTGFAEPRYAMSAIADGGHMHVAPGSYFLPFGIANTGDTANATHPNFGPNTSIPAGAARFTSGITITGAGSYGSAPTIFNGLGGVGNGHRMTFGQGFLYDRVGCTIEGIQFVNCGGADRVGDGEAGVYAAQFIAAKTVTVNKCAFDNNENGIFVQSVVQSGGSPFQDITVVLNHCDFSLVTSNGQSRDGLSHDFYINAAHTFVNYCNFYGNVNGNSMKSRSLDLTVDHCFISRNSNRCIDYPNGGILTVSNTILQDTAGATTNLLEYAAEGLNGDAFGNVYADPVFTNCTINISRYQSFIWMAQPGPAKFVFTGVTQNWYHEQDPTVTLIPTRDSSSLDATAASGLSLVVPGGTLPPLPAQPASASYP